MGWAARLQLDYHRDGETTQARDRHDGPLRVLQALYPEGPAICHHVLVHPPGGLVGGDTLALELALAGTSHALITTPGAARFYRSRGDLALQTVDARLGDAARLEWLPLETIAYSGCRGESRLRFELAPRAQMLGWDVLALGLPAADQPFERGSYRQSIELPGRWLEQGRIDADDRVLLDSPLGLDGQRVLGTAWFAAGAPLAPDLREALLAAAREEISGDALARRAGATSMHDEVVVLRAVAPRTEALMALFGRVRARWRDIAWGLVADAPRVWRT
jgi:urease accessory protein